MISLKLFITVEHPRVKMKSVAKRLPKMQVDHLNTKANKDNEATFRSEKCDKNLI